MFDIITIGAATRDVFLRSNAWKVRKDLTSPTGFEQCLPFGSKVPIEEIAFTTGGGATNTAVTCSRLGRLRTATICRIGSRDTGGQAVIHDLRQEGVATTFVQQDSKHHTGYSMILLSDKGERTILVHRGASDRLAANEIPWAKLRAKRFYLTSLGGDLALAKRIFAHAARIGARVAWNPGNAEIAQGWERVAPLIARCHVFNLNREEAAALTGYDSKNLKSIIAKLWSVRSLECPACGPDCAACRAVSGVYTLVTDGTGGAYAHDGQTTWHIASRNLKVVNATGAGDAFGSAFVLGLEVGGRRSEVGNSIDFALRLAMANAEGVITHMGAKAGILSKVPSRAALSKYCVREIRLTEAR